ncbi:restriction endonuclease [Thermodesulfobacteriota bacterium]
MSSWYSDSCELYGTIGADRVTAGLLATTSTFTRGAREFQRAIKHMMALADHFNLLDWFEKALSST